MSTVRWQYILDDIQLSIPAHNFSAFFSSTDLIEQLPESATVAVKNVFIKSQFEGRYDKLVREALAKNGYNPKTINYTVKSSGKSKRAGVSREILPTGDGDELVSNDRSMGINTITPSYVGNSLNSRYTFDSFIVGSSNDLAYTACQAVAENPGHKYNPLFIYGGVGLGKTHLIQAVGNQITANNPKAKVLYVSSETFVKEFLEYIRFKKAGFSDKYRNIDVLIIDDIQFIASKEKTQDEFFHTFNSLHQANKQVIISSDKPPRSIPTLTERLRSRLEWGMAIDIQMPDFETRCAILEIKASQSGATLDRETVEFLATNIKSNVRELEGALNQLLAYSEMRNVPADLSTAEGLLGDTRRARPRHLTAKQVVDKTAKQFGINVDEICSPRRDKHIVVPRQIAMYLLRSELHLSFPQIARELGRKDHTTAIHSVEKIQKSIKLDFMIREQVAELRDKLYA